MSLSFPNSFLTLNIPDNKHHLVQELSQSFHDKQNDSGRVKYDFNICMVTRPLQAIRILKINKLSHDPHIKMKKIVIDVFLSFWTVGKTSGDLKKTSQ